MRAIARVVELMPEYRAAELGVYAIYPSRRHIAPKIRALIAFLGVACNYEEWRQVVVYFYPKANFDFEHGLPRALN